MYFKDIDELKNIENVSFSLKELIDLCKSNDCQVAIYAKDEGTETTIEIEPYKKFNMNDSIEKNLKTVKLKID